MVGLGESTAQIDATLRDLRAVGVDFLTIGQYLPPTRNHALVKKYYTPDEFLELRTTALQLGFAHVESGPLVRSSYHAQNALQ
jgi:lipoic acid synthetase